MKIYHKVLSLFFLVSLLVAAVPAQKPRGGAVAGNKSPAAAPKCSGAWTGSIVYSRTQAMSDNKTVQRVSGRGEDKREWEMKYDYRAQVAVIEDPLKNGSSNGRASVKHDFSSVEKIEATEKNSCDRGKTWRDMKGTSTSTTKTTGSEAGVESNVSVGVNADGTYSVSVGIPQIRGEVSGSQTSAFSGQCTHKEGKDITMPPTVTTIDGNSLTSDGTNRINPDDPNKISGSYSRTWQNVTETITWNLQKCGAPLRIIDLKFEDMKFPNWDDWREVQEQTGTIDGNWVKVKAKVLNASGETKYGEVSFKETYKGDKWDGAKPDMPLKDNTVSVRLDAGEEREVEILWDTSGYAWFDDGRPRLVQRVKTEIWENNKLIDNMTKNIKVAPKPLVLVHGLWSNWKAWETWQNILTTSHSYDWKAFPVGEKADKGIMNTGGAFLSTEPTGSIADNARQLENYIKYAQEDRNAWHVDIVAHSMGGLISRYYISQIMPGNLPDGKPKVAHLVMLGTPNMGSPCADVMNFAFEMVGKNVEAVRQLQQDYVAGFNRINTARKGVRFSVLAGNPLPTMCKSIVWNDGVVPVPSAKWVIADNAESRSIHTDLTGTSDFSSFVKPRLAQGPRGNHMPDVQIPGQVGSFSNELPAFVPVSFDANVEFARSLMPRVYGMRSFSTETLAAGSLGDASPPFAKAVRIAPKQSTEIELPVGTGTNFGVTFMADTFVSGTLIDDKGATVGTNLAKTPESRGWFRSIFVDKPTAAGVWRIKLQNTGDFEYEAVLTTWSDAVR
jgi:pimeloyl-ACP methyl ester carboxylesterase